MSVHHDNDAVCTECYSATTIDQEIPSVRKSAKKVTDGAVLQRNDVYLASVSHKNG